MIRNVSCASNQHIKDHVTLKTEVIAAESSITGIEMYSNGLLSYYKVVYIKYFIYVK